jgi:hypothetical protein
MLERHKAVEKCMRQQIAKVRSKSSTTGRVWVVAAAIEISVGWSFAYNSSADSDDGESTDDFNCML